MLGEQVGWESFSRDMDDAFLIWGHFWRHPGKVWQCNDFVHPSDQCIAPGNELVLVSSSLQGLCLAFQALESDPALPNLSTSFHSLYSCHRDLSVLLHPDPTVQVLLSFSFSTKSSLTPSTSKGSFILLVRLQCKTKSHKDLFLFLICYPHLSNHISGTLRSDVPLMYTKILAALREIFTVYWRFEIDKVPFFTEVARQWLGKDHKQGPIME